MGVELKLCPWCGRQPTEKVAAWSGARVVCCTPCFTGDYSVKEWSDRPLEDALRARAEAAEQRAEALAAEVARLRADAVTLVHAVLRSDRLPDADVVEVMRRVVQSEAQPAEVSDGE